MCNKYEIGKEVQMLSRKIKRKLDETFVGCGVTGVQVLILKFIYDNSKDRKVYAKDIENEFDLRRATITGILKLLEQNSLIKRNVVDEDTRLKELVVTEKALVIINKIDKTLKEFENNLIKDISKDELLCFINTMDKLSQNLSEIVKKGVYYDKKII